ncbi:MAG TPA: LysR family transcriptional regulator [Verrucomicrobiae bacterium]
MYEKLFAEGGLSLDRLRVLVEVAAAGSITKAAPGDAVRQSQYSRQLRELEDFFRVKLVERVGKGLQLTGNGKELARISRFFLRGLSNFQRGCLSEEQTFRIGASATMNQKFLARAVVSEPELARHRFVFETVSDDEVERRLHDLTLDFGIVSRRELSRPLQLGEFGKTGMALFVSRQLAGSRKSAAKLVKDGRARIILAVGEMGGPGSMGMNVFENAEPQLVCESFLSAAEVLRSGRVAAVLPDFVGAEIKDCWRIEASAGKASMRFALAWNPRLLRLNPHVVRTRDALLKALKTTFRERAE